MRDKYWMNNKFDVFCEKLGLEKITENNYSESNCIYLYDNKEINNEELIELLGQSFPKDVEKFRDWHYFHEYDVQKENYIILVINSGRCSALNTSLEICNKTKHKFVSSFNDGYKIMSIFKHCNCC